MRASAGTDIGGAGQRDQGDLDVSKRIPSQRVEDGEVRVPPPACQHQALHRLAQDSRRRFLPYPPILPR